MIAKRARRRRILVDMPAPEIKVRAALRHRRLLEAERLRRERASVAAKAASACASVQRGTEATLARGFHALRRGARASIAAVDRLLTKTPAAAVAERRDKPFLVVGHRGAPRKRVENTLPAMQQAILDGANAVEIDLSMTKDGVIVLWHDWDPNDVVSLARQLGLEGGKFLPRAPKYWSAARRRAHELSLDELRAHYGYQRSLFFFFRKAVEAQIPTLRDFFEWAVREERLAAVFLDVKIPPDCEELAEPFVKRCTALIDEFAPRFACVFMTPHKNILRAMKPHAPRHAFSWDIEIAPGIVVDEERFSGVRAAVQEANAIASIGRPALTFGAWRLYESIIERDVAALRAHEGKKDAPVERLISWTINARGEHKRLLRLGVDGILTDYPRRLERLVRREHGTARR